MGSQKLLIRNLRDVRRTDVALVGGKNASLGEMIANLETCGVRIPPGFATTSLLYIYYVEFNGIKGKTSTYLKDWQSGKSTLSETGHAIRTLFIRGDWPTDAAEAIMTAYQDLCKETKVKDIAVAVRSSATAEDLVDVSFAGQQETFLNVTGEIPLLEACTRCYASLFTDRAISYRQDRGFDHMKVALSIGVQKMVRSDIGGAGVMFSIDTESGFDKIVLINAAWGLGENVVQGEVNPDEYQVFKPLLEIPGKKPILEKRLGEKKIKMIYGDTLRPTRNVPTSKAERDNFVLSDSEILHLSRWACTIEQHYGMYMDMEWAKDEVGNLWIVQARPETVHSSCQTPIFKTYTVGKKGQLLTSGLSVGDAAVNGRVCLIEDVKDIENFVDGSILVTKNTDPDWVPVMKKAAAVVTDNGGRTSHAAVLSRELGIPAVVGTRYGTYILHSGQDVTVSCAQGDLGFIYQGAAEISVAASDVTELPQTRTKVMLNLANPSAAYRWWRLPADGIGLARMEFVISNLIRIHPNALVHFDQVRDEIARREIERLTAAYHDKKEYFVEKLALGLARLCAVAFPNPAIIRMSDFKTNEYANLIGGATFEPKESNPMLGWRGASRYYSPGYKDGFALECQAVKRLREDMGFHNAVVMIPFCRTVKEARKVLEVMTENGLERGKDGLQVYVMCEIPSNVLLAHQFASHFDGFSIGSNDLTQLTLGVDHDSAELAELFDEQDEAVKQLTAKMIVEARREGCKVGLCGQAPSNDPKYARFLVICGISSISCDPSSFVSVKKHVVAAEEKEVRADSPHDQWPIITV